MKYAVACPREIEIDVVITKLRTYDSTAKIIDFIFCTHPSSLEGKNNHLYIVKAKKDLEKKLEKDSFFTACDKLV